MHTLIPLAPISHTLAFGLPGGWEWIVLLVLGLLIFGRRLPEVGRSVGRSIVEFKKGIKGIEEELDEEASKPSTSTVSNAPVIKRELPAQPIEPVPLMREMEQERVPMDVRRDEA